METPFTREQFFHVFEVYNTSVWPTQIVFYLIGLFVIYMIAKRQRYANILLTVFLSFLWLWMGLVYHIGFFSSINKAAMIFGVAYVIQAVLFVYLGILKHKLSFHLDLKDKYHLTGLILVLYALFIYPVLGTMFGHAYPASPTFGLPCPTTIFTFGVLLLASSKVHFSLLIIPFLWSILGFFAATNFGVKEDVGLLIAGILASILIVYKNRHIPESGMQGAPLEV